MNNLKAWRKLHGFTQSQVADMLYVSLLTYQRIEYGQAGFKPAYKALLILLTDDSAKFRAQVKRKIKDI